MKSLLVTAPLHFLRDRDGHVYDPTTMSPYPFWKRYLAVFDKVGIISRTAPVERIPESCVRVDGPGVTVHDLPDFLGPWQFLRDKGEVVRRLRPALDEYSAYCLRVPCVVGTLVWKELRRRQCPFGVEVVGDPWDSLSPGAIKTIARPAARWWLTRALRTQCRTAGASAYVTRDALQRRYPPAPGTFSTHYSSIELPPEAVVESPRTDFTGANRIIFVGTLEVLYKAPDVLIQALALTGRSDLHLTIVGGGRVRAELEALARSVGVADQVRFAGRLESGEEVRAALDDADLFVLASRQEGLPRATIEAMARSLPCIGSTVGGIPELLPPENLVPPGDAAALASKMVEFLGDSERMCRASQNNLERSREYLAPVLANRRKQFYEEVLRLRGAARGGGAN